MGELVEAEVGPETPENQVEMEKQQESSLTHQTIQKMDRSGFLSNAGGNARTFGSAQSDLDVENDFLNVEAPYMKGPNPLQAMASGGQHSESNAAYFMWPTSSRLIDSAEDRANYFMNLQKDVLPENVDQLPTGQQAATLLELMTIRAFHSKILRRYSLGTAVGFRIRLGELTNIPAILVFVARKVHKQWLNQIQCLPSALEGPGGVWCDVDVVEFSYYGTPAPPPKEQLYTELVDGLRGSDPCIGSGSQVASQETYGTLGAIVKSRTGSRQVGFLTNRHVAVDLDYPNQKMFHPLPPNLGPGVYLGAVERATSFITDDLWYGIYAGTNPETFVRADGAFIPFSDSLDVANVTTSTKGIGEIGDVMDVDLQSPISSLIGKQVVKIGRSSGLTTGTVMAYALEYNDEKGICFFTDFLVVGENQNTFDLEGDSGSLILMTGEGIDKPRPIGIIWGGTANRGRLKLKNGCSPQNWTSGVDLGRLLNLLELDLITTNGALQEAIEEQRRRCASAAAAVAAAFNSSSAEDDQSSPQGCSSDAKSVKDMRDSLFEPLGVNINRLPVEDVCSFAEVDMMRRNEEFQVQEIGGTSSTSKEHDFIPNLLDELTKQPQQEAEETEVKNLSALRDASNHDIGIGLQLGERDPKRKRMDSTCLS